MKTNVTFNDVAGLAMQQIIQDESLYDGLSDDEATILVQWAEGRIGLALAGVVDDAVARRALNLELERLTLAFRAITRQVNFFRPGDRGVMIAAAAAVLSELWNAGK